MFSQTTYMEQDSTNNHLALAKFNRVSKYTLSVQRLCYKGSRKKYYRFIILVMSSKTSLTSSIKKMIKQVP